MKGCIFEANFEGQGWETPFLLFLTWGLRYFWKIGNTRKRVCWNRGRKHLYTFCIGVSRKFHAKPVCFFVIKRIPKALFFFSPWLLNSSDLPSYGSNSRKRGTLKLLAMCLRRSIPRIGGKSPPLPATPSSIPLDGHL